MQTEERRDWERSLTPSSQTAANEPRERETARIKLEICYLRKLSDTHETVRDRDHHWVAHRKKRAQLEDALLSWRITYMLRQWETDRTLFWPLHWHLVGWKDGNWNGKFCVEISDDFLWQFSVSFEFQASGKNILTVFFNNCEVFFLYLYVRLNLNKQLNEANLIW